MSKKGKNVTIKGVLYEDGSIESKEDIYNSKDKNKLPKFDEAGKEAVAGEVVSQTTQSGIQAVVAQVQTQAANLGASGLIAVGSAGAFQVEHMNDNYEAAMEIATPIVAELVETGTISQETIATVLPSDSKFQGKELPVAEKVLGKPVGEYKKALDAEKNKSDEQKAIEKAIQDATSPPNPSDGEKDGSMTFIEKDRSAT
jgi:Sec-independent protein translocase protein TatA